MFKSPLPIVVKLFIKKFKKKKNSEEVWIVLFDILWNNLQTIQALWAPINQDFGV